MLEAGESLAVIRAFLGHASISSTLVYASVTPELANKYLLLRDSFPQSESPVEEKEVSVKEMLTFMQVPKATIQKATIT